MQCEMCGKEDRLFKVKVEGVEMSLCKVCSKYGTPVSKPSSSKKPVKKNVTSRMSKRKLKDFEQETERLKENYGVIVKNKREKEGMKQKDLAKMLSEKESLIHKIESSSITISINFAKKIQKILGVKIIEPVSGENKAVSNKSKGEGMTLGDLIKDKF